MPAIAKSLTFLLELGWQIRDYADREVYNPSKAEAAATAEKGHLLLRGTIEYGRWRKPLQDVVGVFNRRESFIPLADGAVGLLPTEICGSDFSQIAGEGEIVSEGVSFANSQLGVIGALLDNPSVTTPFSDALRRLATSEWQGSTAMPQLVDFKGVLRPYQAEGLRWLHTLYEGSLAGLLADDMGLGKTVQILALISCCPSQEKKPHLIVAPTSLLFNWRMEIERFLPDKKLYIHQGPGRSQDSCHLTSHDIVITSYALLRQDMNLLQTVTWHMLIADEAQIIKNAHTKSSQALCSLPSSFRLAISGTPIENKLEELWSYFRFLLPDLFSDEKSFAALVMQSESDPRPLQAIKRKVRPFILRRTKNEVAKDLPPKEEQTVWIEMGDEQRKLYDDFISRSRSQLMEKVQREGLSKHRMDVLELLLRLRQLCCHPLLLSSLLGAESSCTSAKADRLVDDLQQIAAEGRKVLVYSQFTSFLTLLKQSLQKIELPFLYLDGQSRDREESVHSFQNDPSQPIFLISLKAGGVGLNLTAADYVLIADPWWNDAAEQQAIDRAHRIGRRDTVIARRYVCHATIEEKIMRLKERKRSLAHAILADSDDPIANMTFAELQALLESEQ